MPLASWHDNALMTQPGPGRGGRGPARGRPGLSLVPGHSDSGLGVTGRPGGSDESRRPRGPAVTVPAHSEPFR
eukprot:749017-Hanusia_phi.AAC.6